MLFLLGAAAIAASAHAQDSPPSCLRLEGLTAQALPRHPRLLASFGEHRARLADVEAGQAANNPKFSVGMDAASVDGPYGRGTTPAFAPFAKASKLIWDGGKVDADVRRRELTAEAGLLDAGAVRNDLAAGMAEAYVELLRQQRLLGAADALVAGMERIVGKMEETVRIDRGRRADLDLARARRSTALSTRTAVRIALDDAVFRLRRYLAHTPRAVGVQADACYGAPDFSAALPAALEDARREADAANPQLVVARKTLLALREQARLEGLKDRPSANLEVVARSVRDSDGSTHYLGQLEVRIATNWDAWDGGAVAAASTAARERVAAAEDALIAQRQELEALVLQYWQQRVERRGRQPGLENNLAQVKNVRNDAEAQFIAGRRSLLDLLNFENDVFNAHQLLLANQADLLLAEARLLTLVGMLPAANP